MTPEEKLTHMHKVYVVFTYNLHSIMVQLCLTTEVSKRFQVTFGHISHSIFLSFFLLVKYKFTKTKQAYIT